MPTFTRCERDDSIQSAVHENRRTRNAANRRFGIDRAFHRDGPFEQFPGTAAAVHLSTENPHQLRIVQGAVAIEEVADERVGTTFADPPGCADTRYPGEWSSVAEERRTDQTLSSRNPVSPSAKCRRSGDAVVTRPRGRRGMRPGNCRPAPPEPADCARQPHRRRTGRPAAATRRARPGRRRRNRADRRQPPTGRLERTGRARAATRRRDGRTRATARRLGHPPRRTTLACPPRCGPSVVR